MKKRSKYRYFTEVKWAEQFIEGYIRFRSLSYFQQIEDGEVRGDANEGSVSMKPKTGLVMQHERLGEIPFPMVRFIPALEPMRSSFCVPVIR